jgi:hypothetical protein
MRLLQFDTVFSEEVGSATIGTCTTAVNIGFTYNSLRRM